LLTSTESALIITDQAHEASDLRQRRKDSGSLLKTG
jgi:hypothetical protein